MGFSPQYRKYRYCKIPGFFTLKISNVVFLQNTKTFNTVCHLKKENYTYGTVIKQINCRFIGPMFAFCNLCRTRTASYPYERTQKDVFSQLYDIRRFLNKLPLIFLRQHIQTDRNFDQTSFELIKSSKWHQDDVIFRHSDIRVSVWVRNNVLTILWQFGVHSISGFGVTWEGGGGSPSWSQKVQKSPVWIELTNDKQRDVLDRDW